MQTHKVYSSWQRRREVPQIKLQGLWLEAAGLNVGSALRVIAERGRLVIELAETPPSSVLPFPQKQPVNLAAA